MTMSPGRTAAMGLVLPSARRMGLCGDEAALPPAEPVAGPAGPFRQAFQPEFFQLCWVQHAATLAPHGRHDDAVDTTFTAGANLLADGIAFSGFLLAGFDPREIRLRLPLAGAA
jgi:hypothetical protein